MIDYLKVIYNKERTPYTTYPNQLAKYLFDRFQMKANQIFLEVGCGRGEFLSGFLKLGLNCYGTDLSEEAKKYMPNIDISRCNVEKELLPYSDNFFDIIYSKSLLEHLREPENFLKEARRILKPGGLILTLVPDWESNYKIYFDDFTHKTPFSKISLNDILIVSGLNNVSVDKFRQLPIAWKYPSLNIVCSSISPFIPVRTKNKFLRWSRELMLIGSATK
jgi:SAM-dependent methyltransferase